MKKQDDRGRGVSLRVSLAIAGVVAAAWAAVVIFNASRIPESLSGPEVRRYFLRLFLANLALLAVCIHLSLGSLVRWVREARPAGRWVLLAEGLPVLLLVGYGALVLAGTPRFFNGVFNYLAFIGAGG